MRRRSPPSHAAISLFPFLDTLMCTMGALILLLIALALRMSPTGTLEEMLEQAASGLPIATGAAASSAADDPPEQPAASQPSAEEEEQRQRDLAERARLREEQRAEWSTALTVARSERDRERSALDRQRQALAAAAEKIRDLRQRAVRSTKDEAAARDARESAVASVEQLKAREEQFRAQIEATRRKLDVEQRKQATRSNEYAIVPYDGASGTLRRPIYIECTSRGYRLMQENLLIDGNDIEGFRTSFNPLLSATDALLRYWNVHRVQSIDDEPEPYVLLIVRPGGITNYLKARMMLAPLGAHFGYELVEDDRKVAAPELDPGARAAAQDALEITLAAREKVRELRVASGTERGGAGARRGGGGRPGAAPAEFQGGAGGSAVRGRPASGPADDAWDDLIGRPADAGGGTVGQKSAAGRGGKANSSGAVAAGMNGRPQGFGTGTDDTGPDAALPPAGAAARNSGRSGGSGSGGRGVAARPATLSGRDPDEIDEDFAQRSGAFGNGPRTVRGAESSEVGDVPPLAALPDEIGPSRRTAVTAARARGTRGTASESDPSSGGDADGQPARASGGGRSKGAKDGEVPSDEAQDGEDESHVVEVGKSRSGRGGGKSAGVAVNDPSAAGGSGVPGVSVSPSGGSDGSPSGSGGAGVSIGIGKGQKGNGSQGGGGRRGWGKGSARGDIGLERKLDIQVRDEMVLVGPDELAIPVKRGEKSEDLARWVVAGIDQTAASWGAPPAKFYWAPTVKFVVQPGGAATYERVRGLLEKQGIGSTVEYAANRQPEPRGGPRP